jgi:hypothetical protein
MARNWREYKSEAILGERVVDAMDHEVASENPFVLGNVVHPVVFSVEEETMKHILG